MASSSNESAAKANLFGKRKPEDDLETKPILKKHKETSEEKETTEGFADSLQHTNLISVMEAAITKTLYVTNLYRNIKISDIINFFKDVGEVVHVRLIVNSKGCYACWCFVEFASANEAEKVRVVLYIKFFEDVGEVVHVRIIVDHMGEHVDCGFVEFASSNEAEKAMEKKNGQYLCYCRIFLGVVEKAPYPLRPKYNLAEKLWYKNNLRRGRHLKTKSNLKKQKPSIVDLCCLIDEIREKGLKQGKDVILWKGKGDLNKSTFSTHETWEATREAKPRIEWYQGIWFLHATPKHSFIAWLATKNRLATRDRMLNWRAGVNTSCVFCNEPVEDRDHRIDGSFDSGDWKFPMTGDITRGRSLRTAPFRVSSIVM
ncbi:RNA recognition motif domain [Arabidopsis suecica]|uniref:RNA recognition motif domain n=1 Tax=Arabidopsis suecica TaxID=45249 RepID=A0A8T1YQL6_ARASU|nr:RNA recognition motif domain [Arabidopsis suecica]